MKISPSSAMPSRRSWPTGFSRLAAIAMLALAPEAFAGKGAMLYKCVSAAGVTSIQSNACPTGSTEAWHRDTTPEPAPTPEQAAQQEAKRLRDQQTVRDLSEQIDRKLQPAAPAPAASASASVSPVPASAESDPCRDAQAFADSARAKPWLALSDDQQQRLYTWVGEQCKAPVPGKN
jgi:hypothetical protein